MQIERDILNDLVEWKNSPYRKPLLLKGMRQCGKSWILDNFGAKHFENVIHLNFDRKSDLPSLFEKSLEPERILNDLRVFTRREIVPNDTLIIFDEIQACPRALNSLKYFCEDMPQYAIAAAGSLLGLQLAQPGGFPVGKVDILELNPCSFKEYLRAADPQLNEYVSSIGVETIPAIFTNSLETYFREYLTWGGLPEVASTYLDTHDPIKTEHVLESVLQAYEADFGKHVPGNDVTKVHLIWQSLPCQFAKDNRKFVYDEVRAGARARDLEDALMWLVNAVLVKKLMCVDVPEMPLLASADRKIFKLYPTDVGILRRLADLPPEKVLLSQDIFSTFKGRLAENFVLQQLSAMHIHPICYWYNQSGKAEVDFLVQAAGMVLPIEVKSGLSVKAKSLKVFREKFNPPLAIRTSLQNLRFDDGLLNIPLYLLNELPRLLNLLRNQGA